MTIANLISIDYTNSTRNTSHLPALAPTGTRSVPLTFFFLEFLPLREGRSHTVHLIRGGADIAVFGRTFPWSKFTGN